MLQTDSRLGCKEQKCDTIAWIPRPKCRFHDVLNVIVGKFSREILGKEPKRSASWHVLEYDVLKK